MLWAVIALSATVAMGANGPPSEEDGFDCSTLLVQGVAIPRQGLTLLARASRMGSPRPDFRIRAYGGTYDDLYRIMIILGVREEVSSRQSSSIKGLIMRRFPFKTNEKTLSEGYSGRLWSMLTGAHDIEKGAYMGRRLTSNWRNNATEQVLLAIVSSRDVDDMAEELERLNYDPIDLPGVDSVVELGGDDDDVVTLGTSGPGPDDDDDDR